MKLKSVAVMLFSVCSINALASDKIVIAHRGASAYLPEHTLPAKAAAHAMGADYLEQDVVMTKDDHVVVLHDHYLDRVTDVAKQFPDRKRKDGRYYAIDFTLAEIKALNFTEEFSIVDGKEKQKFPNRFPMWKSTFKIHTLEEEIEMIQGMNHARNMDVGIYVETKAPWFHKLEGKDISLKVLEIIKKYGYSKKTDKVYLQSFDAPDLMRVKSKLLPQLGMNIKLVQLISYTEDKETMEIHADGSTSNYNYDWMFVSGGAKKIAEYADGIGPWFPMIVKDTSTHDKIELTVLAKEAHEAKLQIHPYTFRADPGKVPSYAKDFEDMLKIFYFDANVDGVFTDFPDLAVQYLKKHDMETKK